MLVHQKNETVFLCGRSAPCRPQRAGRAAGGGAAESLRTGAAAAAGERERGGARLQPQTQQISGPGPASDPGYLYSTMFVDNGKPKVYSKVIPFYKLTEKVNLF